MQPGNREEREPDDLRIVIRCLVRELGIDVDDVVLVRLGRERSIEAS